MPVIQEGKMLSQSSRKQKYFPGSLAVNQRDTNRHKAHCIVSLQKIPNNSGKGAGQLDWIIMGDVAGLHEGTKER